MPPHPWAAKSKRKMGAAVVDWHIKDGFRFPAGPSAGAGDFSH
jgi:hypothetical protein